MWIDSRNMSNKFKSVVLFLQAKFHEDAKYIILYSKMELWQPFRSLIKNKKFPPEKLRDQSNLYPAT